jgi:hypothetical protein
VYVIGLVPFEFWSSAVVGFRGTGILLRITHSDFHPLFVVLIILLFIILIPLHLGFKELEDN